MKEETEDERIKDFYLIVGNELENLLQELLQEDFDVSITGFNSEEIDDLLNEYLETEEDNFDIEEAINEITEPITKPGDIWILGNHRLMCRR